MTDPKKTIEKITRTIRNPENAAALERIETNSHLEDIKEGLKPTSKVTSFIQHFLDEVTPKKGVDYLPDEEMTGIKKELTPVKGKDFYTPEEINQIKEEVTPKFGEDYFTPEHIEQIKEGIKEEVTPQKGIHYFDGENGYTPVKGVDYFDGKNADEARIISAVRSQVKDGVSPKIEDIVKATLKHLETLKGNDRPSLKMFRESDDLIGTVSLHKNMMQRMPKSLIDGDQRWHGSGSSTGGGFTVLNTTSTVNNSNQAFVFPTATAQPTVIVSDGVWFTATDSNGVVQWSWSGTIATLVIPPPINSLFAVQ